MKKINDLKKMTLEELNDEILNLRKEQFTLRLRKANKDLVRTHDVKAVRRNIARVKTIITQKAGEAHV